MPAPIVKFTADEKEKLVTFLKEKATFFKKRVITMKKELQMLKSCLEVKPVSVTSKWTEDLHARIKDYSERIELLYSGEGRYTQLITGVTLNSTIKIDAQIARDFLELYNREREGRKIEPIYKYYPRLKKAKEAALYVFSEKIKIFMESKNVKIAA